VHLGVRDSDCRYESGYKKKNEKNGCPTSLMFWLKARNNARPPDTVTLQWKAILSVLDPKFGCFHWISRKQRLLVKTLKLQTFETQNLSSCCLHSSYGIAIEQWFSTCGSRTPRASPEDFQGYLDDSWVFMNCYFLISSTRGKYWPIENSA